MSSTVPSQINPSQTVPAQPTRPGATDWTTFAQNARQNAPPAFPCRVCGAQAVGGRAECPLCAAPNGMTVNPYDATASTYFPVGVAAPSGTRKQTADPIEARPALAVPPEIARQRWHWGAFGLSSAWLLTRHLAGWGMIALGLSLLSPLAYFGLPYLAPAVCGLLLSLLFGTQGARLAWQQGVYPDVPTFMQDERRWKMMGILGATTKLLTLLALILLALRR